METILEEPIQPEAETPPTTLEMLYALAKQNEALAERVCELEARDGVEARLRARELRETVARLTKSTHQLELDYVRDAVEIARLSNDAHSAGEQITLLRQLWAKTEQAQAALALQLQTNSSKTKNCLEANAKITSNVVDISENVKRIEQRCRTSESLVDSSLKILQGHIRDEHADTARAQDLALLAKTVDSLAKLTDKVLNNELAMADKLAQLIARANAQAV